MKIMHVGDILNTHAEMIIVVVVIAFGLINTEQELNVKMNFLFEF